MCRTLGASVLLLNHFLMGKEESGHQGQTSVLLLNHYLMGKEESRWQVLSPRHLDNKTSLLEIETGRDAPK